MREIVDMTFAVINTGGKQYKVSTNDKLRIEKLSNKEGGSIEFKQVLLINNKDTKKALIALHKEFKLDGSK